MKTLFELWWYNTLYHFNIKLDKTKIPIGDKCIKYTNITEADGTPGYPFVETQMCPYYRKYKDGTIGCMYLAYKGHSLKLEKYEKICETCLK